MKIEAKFEESSWTSFFSILKAFISMYSYVKKSYLTAELVLYFKKFDLKVSDELRIKFTKMGVSVFLDHLVQKS